MSQKNQTRKILNHIKSLCVTFSNKCFGTKCPEKSDKKNYTKSSCVIFCVKMTRYSQRFLKYLKPL